MIDGWMDEQHTLALLAADLYALNTGTVDLSFDYDPSALVQVVDSSNLTV